MAKAVSISLLIQLVSFVVAGATLAYGIDARMETKIKDALLHYATRLQHESSISSLDRRIDHIADLCRRSPP